MGDGACCHYCRKYVCECERAPEPKALRWNAPDSKRIAYLDKLAKDYAAQLDANTARIAALEQQVACSAKERERLQVLLREGVALMSAVDYWGPSVPDAVHDWEVRARRELGGEGA